MNTPLESDGARITRRKLRHLDVCADQGLPIEDPRGAGFENIRLFPKDNSKEIIKSWVPGKNVEEFVASYMIEAEKCS